jgi:hypothetical protein
LFWLVSLSSLRVYVQQALKLVRIACPGTTIITIIMHRIAGIIARSITDRTIIIGIMSALVRAIRTIIRATTACVPTPGTIITATITRRPVACITDGRDGLPPGAVGTCASRWEAIPGRPTTGRASGLTTGPMPGIPKSARSSSGAITLDRSSVGQKTENGSCAAATTVTLCEHARDRWQAPSHSDPHMRPISRGVAGGQ